MYSYTIYFVLCNLVENEQGKFNVSLDLTNLDLSGGRSRGILATQISSTRHEETPIVLQNLGPWPCKDVWVTIIIQFSFGANGVPFVLSNRLLWKLGAFALAESKVSYASARCHLRYGRGDEDMQDNIRRPNIKSGKAEARIPCRQHEDWNRSSSRGK